VLVTHCEKRLFESAALDLSEEVGDFLVRGQLGYSCKAYYGSTTTGTPTAAAEDPRY
jgi:hypothetical protein